MGVLENLLLLPPYLQLQSWQINPSLSQVRLTIASICAIANCPICHLPTRRVHSHYERTLVDLPWGLYRVIWQLQVRKFFCLNTDCPRRIFTERLPGMVLPWARKTFRLAEQLTAIGLFLGGAAGERLAIHIGLRVSRHTLLRLVRQVSLTEPATPRIVGVDDWAYRKGHTYGTILVNLETHQPIALLPDREAETLAKWLKDHPGVEVISRDRARAYEKGASSGAPQAIQVADRFHLLQNLTSALEAVLSDHSSDLKAVVEALALAPVSRPDGSVAVPVPPPPNPDEAVVLAKQRRERRLNIYQQVQSLRERGWSAPAIARSLGIGRSTVFRYLRTAQFPERKGRNDKGRSLLDPYKHYILKRWNSGCREVKQLFREIKKKGYRGSYCTVTRYAQRIRFSQGLAPRQRLSNCSLPEVIEPEKKPLTVRSTAWLVLRRPENRFGARRTATSSTDRPTSRFSSSY